MQPYLTYTPFNKVESIFEFFYEKRFTYGPFRTRKKVDSYEYSELKSTKYYLGNYEKKISGSNTKEIHYIGGVDGLAAVYIIDNGIGTLYYVCTDHLGSITALVDESGTIVEEHSYDAWGRRRNPATWTSPSSWTYPVDNMLEPGLLTRGFTGHEHIDEFGLINMNGRIYDPILGTFLSPDNYVQFPDYSQSLNRYSYALNNPLAYVDPEGELAWFVPVIIGAVVGAYTGASIQSGTAAFWEWEQDAWQGAIVGGIIGATVGLGVSAGLAAGGANITGISTVATGTASFTGPTAATTTAWNITSNALITGTVNITSSYAQGRGLEGAYKSGLIGLGAGAIGGTVASVMEMAKYQPMMSSTIKVQNYVTAGLSGAGDRLLLGYEQGKSDWELVQYGLLGAGEGLLTANLGNKILNVGGLGTTNRVAGRYLSSFLTQSVTSVPGAGLTAYSYYIAGFAGVGGYSQHGIITGTIGGFGFLIATSAIYKTIVPEDYPASPYLQPYGPF